MMEVLVSIAVPAGLLAIAVVLGATTVFGVAVAMRPAVLDRARALSDRRLSLRRATRAFDIPRNVDGWFYRHHRLYGGVVVALALFLLYFLTFEYSDPRWAAVFDARYREVVDIGIDAARIVLWALTLVAFAVGLIVLVRPSALRRLETTANRWLTPRRLTRGLEREHFTLDELFTRHPRSCGTLVALLSAVAVGALLIHWHAILRLMQ